MRMFAASLLLRSISCAVRADPAFLAPSLTLRRPASHSMLQPPAPHLRARCLGLPTRMPASLRMELSSSRAAAGVEVHLVGSGIGGAEYLTVRARALLQRADAVVYDALADEELLALVPRHCERFFVGKRGGQRDKSAAQADIDALLVSLATEGKCKVIVRLKAGDPFIFGRARSEVKALNAAGIKWHVEPGLSSALAAPLLAGVALTGVCFCASF